MESSLIADFNTPPDERIRRVRSVGLAEKGSKKLTTTLIAWAGPMLSNSFEEAFLWHLVWGSSAADAFRAGGYLGTDVKSKAHALLRRDDMAARRSKIEEAVDIMSIQWALSQRAREKTNFIPPVNPTDIPA